jgi:hypothetical protein
MVGDSIMRHCIIGDEESEEVGVQKVLIFGQESMNHRIKSVIDNGLEARISISKIRNSVLQIASDDLLEHPTFTDYAAFFKSRSVPEMHFTRSTNSSRKQLS